MRLLSLLPGSPFEDVKCILGTVTLGDCPDYEALSYCWGDANDTTPIQVNGHTLYITRTLRSALFHLRKVDHVRMLWVDAICINQKDIDERGSQVGIMRQIYSSANRTVVWLGPRDEDSDSAFVICAQISNEAHSPVPDPKSSEVTSTASSHAAIDKNYGSVLNLLKRSWWRRVWVVQEIVLAKKALVVCGTKEMEWETFSLAIEKGISLGIWQETMLGLVTVTYFSFYRSITTMKLSSLADSTAERLLSLLVHVREREATDSRDKVFSVLGLLHGDSKAINITPDYASPPPAIFKETAVSIIKQSQQLDIFGFAITNRNWQDLPSWAPNWGDYGKIPNPLKFDARGILRTTSASRDSSNAARFILDDTVLMLSGQHVDEIKELSEALRQYDQTTDWKASEDIDEDASAIAEFRSAFHDIGTFTTNLFRISAGLTTFVNWEKFANSSGEEEAVYWKTLCGDVTNDELTSMEAAYREWQASLAPVRKLMRWRVDRISPTNMVKSLGFIGYLQKTWERYPAFGTLVAAHASGRRLARSAKGVLCLVPANATEGDSIVLVKGGKFPLVLRSVDSMDDGHKYWALVGECYMHCLMDGESFVESECVEIRLR
jgi:hypothetical protein